MPRTTAQAGPRGRAHGTTAPRTTAQRTTAPRMLATVLLATVLALSGCQTPREGAPGGSPDDSASPDDPVSSDDPTPSATPTDELPATAVAADLTITVDATGEGATQTFTLTCAPAGGDHPDAAAACAALAVAGGAEAFAPTPRDVACTEQWGGPQTATVEGTVGGERVSARFDRTNGCGISRWDRLAAVFGPDAGLM